MLKIYLVSVLPVQPSFFFFVSAFSFFLQHLPSFSSAPHFSCSLFFSGQRPLFCFCSVLLSLVFSASLLLFCRRVALIFSSPKRFCFNPKSFSVQPKTFFSAQNLFQPKTFLLQPKTFFSSAQNLFLAQNVFQPKILFQPVCGSAPPSFLLLQRHFSFF